MPPSFTDLQAILTLLGQAERECTARGNLATHPLDDQAIWHFDADLVWLASETLREAIDPLPPPPGLTVSAAGLDPLELLSEAMQRILELPDDPGSVLLWQARLSTSDALAAVRAHLA